MRYFVRLLSVIHSVWKSEQELNSVIPKSKPTTCPVDPIPAPLLLDILGDLLPALSQIVNDSLLSGSFPSVFKHAILKPLLKKSTLDHNTLVTTVKSKTFPSCPQSLRKSSAAAFRLFQFP